jgi:predicted DNA-binding transcriptional regulator YafY
LPDTKQVERIIRILQRLALKQETTIAQLYEYFEHDVPKRTLQRDLVELSSADIPLRTKPGKGKELVWYLESSYLRFVPMTVGNKELMASYFLERLANVAHGTKLEADIKSLLKKAKQLAPPEVFSLTETMNPSCDLFGATFMGYIDYTDHSATIDLLITAIAERKCCRFKYRPTWKHADSEFEADPYLILYHKGALYAIVFVPNHSNYVFLPVQRIRGVQTTGKSFKRKKDFSLDKLRAGRFGIYGGDNLKPQKVVLTFCPDIADIVAERQWHPSQKVTRKTDGSLTLSMTTVVSDELKSWIAGWMEYVRVDSPKGLKIGRPTQ